MWYVSRKKINFCLLWFHFKETHFEFQIQTLVIFCPLNFICNRQRLRNKEQNTLAWLDYDRSYFTDKMNFRN